MQGMALELGFSVKADASLVTESGAPHGVVTSTVANSRLGFGDSYSVVISLTSGVVSGVVANWLWERLSKASGTVRIELRGRRVALNASAIREALEHLIATNPSSSKDELHDTRSHGSELPGGAGGPH